MVVTVHIKLRACACSALSQGVNTRASSTRAFATAGMSHAPHGHSAEYDRRWHKVWDEGLQPGNAFDAARSSSALGLLLDSDVNVKGKRVLVPGCGRGYDVVEFARRAAAETIGLELSNSAVTAAKAYISQQSLQGKAAMSYRIENGDFFSYHDQGGQFDLGYDYTFLCALQPSMRTSWAEGWTKQLRQGGELITLMFPIVPKPDVEEGPPWPLSLDLYDSLLLPAGFTKTDVRSVPPHLSHGGREGKEWLGRWLKT